MPGCLWFVVAVGLVDDCLLLGVAWCSLVLVAWCCLSSSLVRCASFVVCCLLFGLVVVCGS